MGKLVVENERLKQDKLKLDYFALQDQINPHFLFNNLSTLIAIIQTDQKLAVRFAENFSDVYRYVLQSAEVYWVNLGDEVEFIKACFALHQERLGDGLRFNIDIPAEYFSFSIPPLSLQILVENAIKHNCATLKNPLKIDIFVRNNRLVVVNNLNPRNSSYSTKTGLQNLRKRYALLTEKVPVMTKTENEFIVEIPLIQSNNANESFSS
jgi:LytS/YehU family sensor histidine kinase